jgi:quercetin dioxygenase-like cupin family protein
LKIIVRKPDEVPVVRYDNPEKAWKVTKRVMVGEKEGARHFVTRVFTIEPGGYTPKHTHPWEHEILVIKGKGTVFTEEGDREVEPGTALFVPPGSVHQLSNRSDENFVFACVVPMEGET